MTHIILPRAVVEQVLEALEADNSKLWPSDKRTAAITALKVALAQEQESAPMPLFPPVPQWQRGCAVCGIGADGKAYGYVCPRYDCPTRITCRGTI